jgi:hypothetical protein
MQHDAERTYEKKKAINTLLKREIILPGKGFEESAE